MGHRYSEIACTAAVKAVQQWMGSRATYAKRESGPNVNDRLGPDKEAFIASRANFYIASVSATGWPYLQFRCGPPRFLRVLNEHTLGYADFRGNKQYITTGNVRGNDRVSLFLMDYAHRECLKILCRMAVTDAKDDPELASQLTIKSYNAQVERGVRITIATFEWNCAQHITPRFTQAELIEALAPTRNELAALRAENDKLKRQLDGPRQIEARS